jgi:tetratricopeptide (TPR) repeat protein
MRDVKWDGVLGRLLRSGVAIIAVACTAAQGMHAEQNKQAEDLYHRTDYQASLKLLDSNTADADVQNLIGRNYYMLAEFKRAAEHFQNAANEQPSNSNYALWLGRAWGRRAETSNPLFAAAYASKARQCFEKAVQLDGKNQEALSDLLDYYLEAPAIMGGGFDKAQRIAEQIAATNAAEGYSASARLAERRREYATAEQQLRRALDSAPAEVGRLVDLARFLAKQGRTQESDALFLRASAIAPDSPRVWYARADTLIQSKRNFPEAKLLLHRYLQASITPDDPSKGDAQSLLRIVN